MPENSRWDLIQAFKGEIKNKKSNDIDMLRNTLFML